MRSRKSLPFALILTVVALAVSTPASSAEHYPRPTSDQVLVCVDINTAGVEALQEIIHIGPTRALQIIELRRQRPFGSVDDLIRVKGIAAKRLADIKRQGVACVGDGN